MACKYTLKISLKYKKEKKNYLIPYVMSLAAAY